MERPWRSWQGRRAVIGRHCLLSVTWWWENDLEGEHPKFKKEKRSAEHRASNHLSQFFSTEILRIKFPLTAEHLRGQPEEK